MINIKNFDTKKSYKNIGIYDIGYITTKKLIIMKVIYLLCQLFSFYFYRW